MPQQKCCQLLQQHIANATYYKELTNKYKRYVKIYHIKLQFVVVWQLMENTLSTIMLT